MKVEPSAPGSRLHKRPKKQNFTSLCRIPFKIYCRRTLITVKLETQASVLSGSIPLDSFVEPRFIDLENKMPRGITFDPDVGWLYGTSKYKEDMFIEYLQI